MVDRRKYIRITTVLPIEFFVIDEAGKKVTPWLQGFTQDISRGGLCIQVNDLWRGFWDRFSWRGAQLVLRINFPFHKQAVSLKVKVSWMSEYKIKDFTQYKIGVEFLESDKKTIEALFKYAIIKKSAPFILGGVIAILLIFSSTLLLRNISLTKGSRQLVKDYVGILEKEESLGNILAEERKGKVFFEKRHQELKEMITILKRELSQKMERYEALLLKRKGNFFSEEMDSLQKRISLLETELTVLKRESEFLKLKGNEKRKVEEEIGKKVMHIEKERLQSVRKIVKGMYSWIKNRQDLSTGLVLSYEGDRTLERVYFTYDQAIAAILFLAIGDKDKAEMILDFYLKKASRGEEIYNAYYDQRHVFEYVIHSGPNAWIGIAALCYAKETGSRKYLAIAEKVGDFLFKMMAKGEGVKGGPKDEWYSTEHNLDSFSFFKLFYEVTKKREYLDAADKIKKWIAQYTYTNYGPPVSRGKGDSTIATDTYAWSIAAFGPAALYSLKMNPETILEFAIENCEVEVEFVRNGGAITIKGFDFAKVKNSPRGGVISTEWTSQMILALEIMASYFKNKNLNKSEDYAQRAFLYFNELQKMIITSLSRAGREDPCLPYASKFSVDTGHGWRTSQGSKTGSLSATAYFLLAYYGYNPLKAKFLDVHLKNIYDKKLNKLKVSLSQ
ncbi:MAG: PilZ domain-containing protein [Omnitrophica bacterium]|nr:PilZ domain-containing protein [Candidatus Omnitrophota bacterium]